MEKNNLKFFLGANSCEGFVSEFKSNYIPDGNWKAYIIKGGPGTGKSSFMKYIAVKAADKGLKPVLCPCSSDPNSLDAVILNEKKIIILDGTAPHTVEPSYPGACEILLNFGQFWKTELLRKNSEKIIETTFINKSYHKAAAGYISAAGQLMSDSYKTALSCTDIKKVRRYADGICRKYIPQNSGEGTEWVRFAEGITPIGIVTYAGTLTDEIDRTFVIEDKYGAVGNIIMNKIREYALKNGYEIITLKNPFLPSCITDHIIIPSLSLSFVTENDFVRPDKKVKRIHARRFTDTEKLHSFRERLKFNSKAAKALLLAGVEKLASAKTVHDRLEKYYIDAMDFKKLTEFAEKFSDEIL